MRTINLWRPRRPRFPPPHEPEASAPGAHRAGSTRANRHPPFDFFLLTFDLHRIIGASPFWKATQYFPQPIRSILSSLPVRLGSTNRLGWQVAPFPAGHMGDSGRSGRLALQRLQLACRLRRGVYGIMEAGNRTPLLLPAGRVSEALPPWSF